MAAAGMPAPFTSLHAWRWSAATVASRTMHLPGSCPAGALTPFGDLFNHQPPPAPLLPDLGALGSDFSKVFRAC